MIIIIKNINNTVKIIKKNYTNSSIEASSLSTSSLPFVRVSCFPHILKIPSVSKAKFQKKRVNKY